MARVSSRNPNDSDFSDEDVEGTSVTSLGSRQTRPAGDKSIGPTRRRRGLRSNTRLADREVSTSDGDKDAPISRPARRRKEVASRKPDQPSIVSDMTSDLSGVLAWTLQLPRLLYPIWKWPLIIYIAWLLASYLITYAYVAISDTLAANICPIPIIGSKFPFCLPKDQRSLSYDRFTASQEEFVVVMDQVGQGFDIARDMVGHEFSLRDLKIRVAASNLSRKDELARELEGLIRQTKKTAKGLSRFTAKVSKAIDTAGTFDEYAAKALEGIMERQNQPPSLPGRVFSAISPFAAWHLLSPTETEERVKEVFITTATRISTKVNVLIGDSFELAHDLDSVEETLDHIKEITTDELGDLPRHFVLGALWLSLVRPDDHHEYQSHKTLLEDMCRFYDSSSRVVQETVAALNHVEAELGEFRDDFATPGLTLNEYPLEVIVKLLRMSAERLERGKKDLDRIEGGGKPFQEKKQGTIIKTGAKRNN